MDGKYVLREKAKSLREFGNKVIGAEKSWDNFPEQKCMTAALGGVTHSREHGDGRPWASLPSCELDSAKTRGHGARFPRVSARRAREAKQSGTSSASHFSPKRGRCLTRAGGQTRCPGRLAGPTTLGAAAGTAGLPPDRQHLEKNKSCATLSSSLPDDHGHFPPTRKVQKRRTCRGWTCPSGGRRRGQTDGVAVTCVYDSVRNTASGKPPPNTGLGRELCGQLGVGRGGGKAQETAGIWLIHAALQRKLT